MGALASAVGTAAAGCFARVCAAAAAAAVQGSSWPLGTHCTPIATQQPRQCQRCFPAVLLRSAAVIHQQLAAYCRLCLGSPASTLHQQQHTATTYYQHSTTHLQRQKQLLMGLPAVSASRPRVLVGKMHATVARHQATPPPPLQRAPVLPDKRSQTRPAQCHTCSEPVAFLSHVWTKGVLGYMHAFMCVAAAFPQDCARLNWHMQQPGSDPRTAC